MFGMVQHGGDFGAGAGGGVSVGGASYAIAAGIGAGLLWSLAGSLLSLVSLLGLNLVYLRVTEGLDVDAAPFSQAPPPVVIAADVKPRAQPPESTAPSVAKAITCPQCLSAVAKGDAYCSTCGHKLA
jgi:hypothetical protein